MRRIFIRDLGRYKAGQLHDWPIATWRGIAGWEAATISLEEVLAHVGADEPIRLPDGSLLVRVTDPSVIDHLLHADQHVVEVPSPHPGPRRRGRPPKHAEA